MADHVDVNPSKGAGKSPRLSRQKRKRRTSVEVVEDQLSRSTITGKRKSLSTDHKSSKSKTRRLEEESTVSVHQSNSSRIRTDKKSSKTIEKNNSLVRVGTTRELRKRKSEFTKGRGKKSTKEVSSESEEEEIKIREEEKSLSSKDRRELNLAVVFGTTKTNSRTNTSAGLPASSSSSTTSTTRHGGRHSRPRNHPPPPITTNIQPTRKQTKVKATTTSVQSSNTTTTTTTSTTTTSEEETKEIPTSNITSRLRPTASRAAAAASLKLSLREAALASEAAGSSGKLKTGKITKGFRFSKKQQHLPQSNSTIDPPTTSTKEKETEEDSSLTNPPTTTTDTDETDEVGGSSGSVCSSRFPYQLRSQHNTEIPVSGKTSGINFIGKTTSGKDKGKKVNSGSITTTAGALRSAQILSEKEKNLQRKSSSGSTTSVKSSTGLAGTTGGTTANTRSGRLSSINSKTQANNTTGACTSSRCGRGGGPSGSGPLNGSTSKAGEGGMNNPPTATGPTSSTSSGQGSSSVPTTTETTSGPSPLSGTTASSAFSRGLAMLSVDSDGDEGEMGRLQALLEARGLPPHLFGSLAPRMQQLLNRGMNSTTVSKAQQLLQGLQTTGDEGQQLQAAIEMCQLLVMGNEDTLAGFPVKQTVPALITLLSMEHNFDMMNHACRALTYMMEALPRSTPVVAEAVPVFLEKLQVIQCMDVAEQSLTALEMLSRRHAKTILQANGVSACLTYLDFFSITAQRAALAVTANCCQSVHSDEFHLVSGSLGFLAGRLTEQDKKSVESVCLTFSRLVDSFTSDKSKLEEIASPQLLGNVQQLLVVTPPVVSTGTFILVLRLLAQLCSRCPKIALKLLEQNIVSTLSSLLLGSSTPNIDVIVDEVDLVPRNPQELLEIVTVIGELLPKLPKDGIFTVNTMMTHPHLTCQDAIQWQWRDDRGGWNSYSSFDSRIIEAAHQSGEDEISLTLQSRTYTIDFLGMQQLNEESGTARPVQRKINPFYNPRVPTEVVLEKESMDVRGSYLESHTDFTLPFLRPLFALLSEANSSSAGPAVRQICVKTLLRIVHFLPPDSLQKTLKPQQVSNNLASMLGSSDLKVVVGAFQLSTLFMEKLHNVYIVHFRREGVFHQVSRISSSDVVGPSPIKSEIAALLGVSGSSASTSSSIGITSIPIVSTNNNNPTTSSSYPSVTVPFITTPLSLYSRQAHSQPSPLSNVNGHEPSPPSHHNILPTTTTSPFGLCVGGFFVQPGGTPVPVGSSSEPLLPPQDLQNLNLQGLPLLAVPLNPAATMDLVPPTSNILVHSPQSHVFTRGMTLSSTSSLDSSSEIPPTPPSGTKVLSGSSSEKKSAEPDLATILDPFKRKRTSKRPIPTSTSRRLRQDDPNCGTTVASSASIEGNSKGKEESGSSSSQGQTAPTSGRRSGGKSSGFFASLHPSRWTRGSGNSNSGGSASNNNNNNTNTPSSSGGNPNVGVNNLNLARAQNSSAYLAITYKEQIKGWLKEQSILFSQKYCTSQNEMDGKNVIPVDGSNILPKLGEIITDLRNEKKVLGALEELRTIVLESDISPFEVNHSGLIGALLGFLVDEDGYSTSRDQRHRSFIHVFANCPLNEFSGELLEECLSGSKSSGLSSLVIKLNSCFSQLEQFQVKVHEMPTSSGSSRVAPSSALRFFNTHQLKCVLQRHPNCSSLRQWKGGPVKIDPLALVQAIERYLIVRGFGRPREPRDSGDSDEDNSDDDIDDSLAAVVTSQGSTRHKLQFIMNDQVLPYNMTVYQAIRQFGGAGMDLSSELEGDFIDPTTAVIGSSGIWSQTHTIYYRPLSEDGLPPQVGQSTSSKPTSKKSKSPSSKATKSKKDPLWHEGLVPVPIPPYVKYLSSSLESVTISDPSLPVLTLLRVIHAICRYWRSLYWPHMSGQPLIQQSEFINTKVAAKAQRQLQDPVVIMTGNLPSWLSQIGVACPFLFPFETRQMLFYSTSFDRDRALQRLLDSVPELNSTEREDRVTPRLDRRKRTISREQILAQAEQLMQDFGSARPLLEVQYENEVGTGLGPTLEFYALVSQELQKKELDLWHCESSHSSIGDEITADGKSKSYVETSVGLFPKPLGKTVKATTLSKVKSKFKFIGKFMAKAVMDSRMIDIPLSKTQYKWILGSEGSLSLADMADVDSTVAQSIRKLVSVVSAKKKLELTGLSGIELNLALEALTLDGCRIDNLGLDFTLPGHPSIELRKGGRDTLVTIYNLEEYIKLVIHWMLVGGVHRQMEAWREGFDTVFSSSCLNIFYPEELEMVFCGANQSVGENWDVKTLSECCRPDHGFTIESRAIQFLFEVMSSYDAQERRKFVQFVTGSPRLPVGGFKALQPPLTVVRKTIETGDEDAFLPSVMTCVNYLKLPDYSTIEIMRERLRVAAEEGQMSFHLS